ncbi:MAG: hypothetical protein ACRCTQ_05435 [Brevinemataceae bacterium]
MYAVVLLVLLFTGCSVQNKDFIDNVAGTYVIKDKKVVIECFKINQKSGAFTRGHILYKLESSESPTNAIYKLDDIQYAGLVFDIRKAELYAIYSTNKDSSGIVWNSGSKIFLGMRKK